MPDDSKIVGTVKFFDKDRGYGFLKLPGDSLDVFIHANELRKAGITRILYEGEKVSFMPARSSKGTQATQIKLVEVT